jgi:hypothetical protein
MATKVFISYRRGDGKYQADRIYKAFCQVVPRDHVFMDSESIPPGTDFPKLLKSWVNQCDVLLALISSGWIEDLKARRRRRHQTDWVRVEIGEAFARGIPVIPVLIDGATPPDIGLLPEGMKELADRQAAFVEFRTFDVDTERLVREVLEPARERSLKEYRRQAASAAQELGKLFGFEMSPPPIELERPDYRNVYWDGAKINIPPGLDDTPDLIVDLIVNEVAIPFINRVWDFVWEGQSGALAGSYRDVLTSIVKQARLHQTAEQADWTISPGAMAWLSGKGTREGGTDSYPLRSLKAPVTSQQVEHFRDLVTTAEDGGGIHTNCGIPNKAFYQAATKIGTDKAGRIWLEALKQFRSNTDFPQASRSITAAASRLYGADSPEAVAVREAWNAVGL